MSWPDAGPSEERELGVLLDEPDDLLPGFVVQLLERNLTDHRTAQVAPRPRALGPCAQEEEESETDHCCATTDRHGVPPRVGCRVQFQPPAHCLAASPVSYTHLTLPTS